MTMPHERTQSVHRTEQFLRDCLTKPRVPQWIRKEADCCLRHFPTLGDMLNLEELYLQKQGVSPLSIRRYIAEQVKRYTNG